MRGPTAVQRALGERFVVTVEVDPPRGFNLAALMPELRRLRDLAPEVADDTPLDVHPALVAQGVDGAYGAALAEHLDRYAGTHPCDPLHPSVVYRNTTVAVIHWVADRIRAGPTSRS